MTVDTSSKGFTLPSGPTSLCFDKEEFMKKDFEVDKFILDCKKKVALETLKEDLDLYLKVIRSAMIELINKDYADFVNLSTNLVGMDKAITNLTVPLGQLKEEVLSVQTAMDGAIKAVQEKIRQQQEMQRKKAMLQRLMNITHSVEKIEKLLGIQQGEEPLSPGHEKKDMQVGQLTGPLIERVATEFNKLQFYVTRSKGQPLVEKVKPRIATITTTLQYSLEGSFLSGLETNNSSMLRQCLRTYALIDKTRDAEDLFREHVVRPYMEDVICEDFLRRHHHDLSAMFAQVLEFVPLKCSTLVSVTTGISGGEVVRGYDFTVNAVFPEIVKGLGLRTASIFAPGNPDAFHKKYQSCLWFMGQFERSCGSLASVRRLRQNPSYAKLMGKWSLPVYLQIRFQDIAGQLEAALSSGFSVPSGECEFRLVSTSAVWSSMAQCWEEGVYLPALSHRFLKLNFQLLSRYTIWLNEIYQEEANRNPTPSDPKTRSATPDRLTDSLSDGGRKSPRHTDLLVAPLTAGQIVALMADLDTLRKKVSLLFDEEIYPKFDAQGVENLDSIKEALLESVRECGECRPKFWSMVTEDVVKRCSAFLTQVNDIPRLYRRTNKEVPSKPSTYLSNVVKPLNFFCEEHSGTLIEQQKIDFLTHVFISLAKQFSEVTTEVLTSTRKMEESLLRLRQARGKDKEKEKSGGVSDSDKIRTQIIIDINSFHQQMKQLGLQPESIEGYTQLIALADEAQAALATT